MAAKPQMTVRLAPSILHALEYLAEREGVTPAELARILITAGAQTSLDRHGWRVDCQAAYMEWLGRRRFRGDASGQGDEGEGDLLLDGEPDPAPAPRPVESSGPHGPLDDHSPSPVGWAPPPNRRNPRYDDALVGTLHLRADGKKKRS